jgi:hypothetical protein
MGLGFRLNFEKLCLKQLYSHIKPHSIVEGMLHLCHMCCARVLRGRK